MGVDGVGIPGNTYGWRGALVGLIPGSILVLDWLMRRRKVPIIRMRLLYLATVSTVVVMSAGAVALVLVFGGVNLPLRVAQPLTVAFGFAIQLVMLMPILRFHIGRLRCDSQIELVKSYKALYAPCILSVYGSFLLWAIVTILNRQISLLYISIISSLMVALAIGPTENSLVRSDQRQRRRGCEHSLARGMNEG